MLPVGCGGHPKVKSNQSNRNQKRQQKPFFLLLLSLLWMNVLSDGAEGSPTQGVLPLSPGTTSRWVGRGADGSSAGSAAQGATTSPGVPEVDTSLGSPSWDPSSPEAGRTLDRDPASPGTGMERPGLALPPRAAASVTQTPGAGSVSASSARTGTGTASVLASPTGTGRAGGSALHLTEGDTPPSTGPVRMKRAEFQQIGGALLGTLCQHCKTGSPGDVREVLAAGRARLRLDLFTKAGPEGLLPLTVACLAKNVPVIEALLEAGAKVRVVARRRVSHGPGVMAP